MNDVYWIYEDKFIFKPEFNEPIDKYVDIIKNYSQLIFSNYDDLEICIETNNDYEFKYNHKFIESRFNQQLSNELDNLTCLTHLTLGYYFNQSLEIPFNIKILTLECNNINLIENLPNSIEELNFNYNFELELNNLPNSIKIIRFDKESNYNKELNNLPKQLEILELPDKYNIDLININPDCKIKLNSFL